MYSLKSNRVILGSIVLSFALNGCVDSSIDENLVAPKNISEYKTEKTFLNNEKNPWVIENWWQEYADTQLNEMINEALKDSPNMKVAIARLHKADSFTKIAKASQLPQINANAQITEQKLSYNYLTPRSMTPDGFNDYGQVNLNFNWEIDFWGKNKAMVDAAILDVESANAQIAQTKLIISSSIATNYCELARLFDNEEIIKNSLKLQKDILELLNKRYENGLENKTAINEAKSLILKSENELLSLQEQISLQKNKLAALMGEGPDRGILISRPTLKIDKTNFKLPQDLALNLLGKRPDIVISKLQVEASLKRIDQKKAEFYPNVNLSSFIGLQSLGVNMLDKKDSYNASFGPAISLPIFTAGRLEGELRSNVSNYEESVATYNQAITQALNEVADAIESQKIVSNQLLKTQEDVLEATEISTIKDKRYKAGVSNYLEVLNAQLNLINTKRNLTNLKSRAITLDIALKNALGGGYEQTTITTKGN